jgi:hypothetical protein
MILLECLLSNDATYASLLSKPALLYCTLQRDGTQRGQALDYQSITLWLCHIHMVHSTYSYSITSNITLWLCHIHTVHSTYSYSISFYSAT